MGEGSKLAPPVVAPVDKRGRLTIPRNIRKLLRLKEGDFIIFKVLEVKRAEVRRNETE